jgi:DNA-binding NarL/FixJ family response regulator
MLLADDHPMIRDAFQVYLERLAPEAVVRMPGMNGMNGLHVMRQKYPNVPVVLMSGAARPEDVEAAISAGARGFLPKTLNASALVNAMRLILAGETFVPYGSMPVPGSRGENGADHHDGEIMHSLTAREREVMPLLEQGLSNKEIARLLDVQEVTIKLHVRGICRKLGAKNRTQAAMRAHELRSEHA